MNIVSRETAQRTDLPRTLPYTIWWIPVELRDPVWACAANIEKQLAAIHDEGDWDALAVFVGNRLDLSEQLEFLYDASCAVSVAAGRSHREFLAALTTYRAELRDLALIVRGLR